VPAQWMKIVKNEKLKHVPLLGFSGAAPLPPDASREMESEKGGLMGEVYGQSEANVVVTANVSLVNKFLPGGEKSLFIVRATTPLLLKMIPSLFSFAQTRFGYWLFSSLKKITAPAARRMIKRKAKSRKVARGVKKGCGIPLPDTDVKLLNIDTGEEVPIGEPGELYYRGPQLMLGYWPKVGNGLTEDGYLGSGDVAIMDEDGFFQIVDRTKDMINVAGFKVYSEVLDELLSTHPSVYLAGCIGAPDPERPGSEKVAAFIQLNEGYAPSKDLETELTEMADKKLPAYYKPKIYVFLDDMPLNHVDKVNKLVLREAGVSRC
jgi:long-chain acyl-CoA synthetase